MPHVRRLASIGIAVLAAATLTPAMASAAAPVPQRHPVADHAVTVSAVSSAGSLTRGHRARIRTDVVANPSATCSFNQYYCSWSIKNGNNDLFDPGICIATGQSLSSWGACRNVDESFFNSTNGVVRLFYSPSYAGAWICIPTLTYIGDLSNIIFNNGPATAGYGKSVFNDVASSQVDSKGNCTNPTF